ncbi:ATP-binding protein [Aliivibrio fischeri]|uniref:AAA family ATPase n=1 Tax=Aliivibrio fischeri TaxID=668 RepID=A0A844P2I3_ALIFS|nr:ATP-binding protein [Aliivibrio fischeri]MUJ22535.1 AAA family ATPase [Aliivibrio fischeri]MUK50102.1 AAA family ATPase [Aliivibrio fischeri]
MKEIIFISGIHGVGKTTLCNKIKKHIEINNYSCSDIIKDNSDYVERSKVVSNAEKNQTILLNGIKKIKENKYLLDGHFVLIGKEGRIIELDKAVFFNIAPSMIINISCPVEIIKERLERRDGKTFSKTLLSELQALELKASKEIAKELQIPLYQYTSGEPFYDLIDLL